MTEAWWFDELAHAGREHLDPEFVASYNRKAGPDPIDDVAVLRHHGLDQTSTLIDLGAGTGRLALAAAPFCRRVVAVDVSAAMLDVLRQEVLRAGMTNLDCVEAGFLTYEHDGPQVDTVYTRNALHHLPDFWKAVAVGRMAQLLRPRGVLRLRDLVFDFRASEAEGAIAHWLDGAVQDPAQGYTRDDLVEHLRSEYSTFSWLLEPMITNAGFEIVEAEFDRSAYGRYTCIKR